MFNKTKIQSVHAREILDSRGNPTVEVEVVLRDGNTGIAGVPSGASKGLNEALEIRDGDKNRYGGKGVLTVCEHVNRILEGILKGKGELSQDGLDKLLIELNSGSENKSKLGANAILGVSMAFAKAVAKSKGIDLFEYIKFIYNVSNRTKKIPIPMFNILNGGQHASNDIDIQEFMVVPIASIEYPEKLRMGAEIFHILGKTLKAQGLNTGIGDEGGFAPKIKSHNQVFESIIEAGEKANYKIGKDYLIAIDAAASSFYKKESGNYHFKLEDKKLSKSQLIELYKSWAEKYFVFSIEDGLYEEDFDGWNKMREELSEVQIVADDLTVTNVSRLKKAIEADSANAIIIKPNQIGTLTETLSCVKKAQEKDWKIIVSHRSGDTCDDFIADLAVGVDADFIKTGAPSRGERVAKYNRLLKIFDLCIKKNR